MQWSTRCTRTVGTVRTQCAILQGKGRSILTAHVCITRTRGFWIVVRVPARLRTRVIWRSL